MNSIRQIDEIFTVLKDAGVSSFDDLLKLDLSHGKLLSAQKYSWVAGLASILNTMYYDTEKHIGELGGQFFLVDEMKKEYAQDLMKYSCLFPDRMVVSAGEFHYLDDPNYAFVDIDFFRKLFLGKDLLLRNIVHISPFYLCTDIKKGEGDIKNAMLEYLTLPKENEKKIAYLDRAGSGEESIHPVIQSISVALPWLKNASIDDYVDIISQNKNEFLNYNNYLSHLSQESEDTQDFIARYTQDYEEATTNIRISLEKKRAELKRKGFFTALSICLTIIPIVLPQNIGITNGILSTILGGGTINSLIDFVPEAMSMKDIEKENSFWVLWKWGKSS